MKKNNIAQYIILLCTLLLTTACHREERFTVEGTLSHCDGQNLYIEELSPTGTVFLDSITPDAEGHFHYTAKLPYSSFYNLHSSAVDYIVLLPEDGETIQITGDYRSLQMTYEVSGSTGSTLLWQLQDYTNDGIRTLTELVAQDRRNKEQYGDNTPAYKKAKEQTDSVFRDAMQSQGEYMSHFIQENKGSLATIIALYKEFNHRPLITPQDNFDYYELVLEGLQESLPDNPHTIHFKNTVERLRHQFGQPREALDMVFDGE